VLYSSFQVLIKERMSPGPKLPTWSPPGKFREGPLPAPTRAAGKGRSSSPAGPEHDPTGLPGDGLEPGYFILVRKVL